MVGARSELGSAKGGRQFVWSGKGQGTVALSGPRAVNLLRHANADLLLEIEYRVDERPTGCEHVCAQRTARTHE